MGHLLGGFSRVVWIMEIGAKALSLHLNPRSEVTSPVSFTRAALSPEDGQEAGGAGGRMGRRVDGLETR